ncbi:hypothetical protein RyT2_21390 [Pseudolactococcus yaeyamensis]
MLTIGMMSGTSLDGIDVALVEINEEKGEKLGVSLLDFFTQPYPDTIVAPILDAMSPQKSNVLLICQLNVALGKFYGKVAKQMMGRRFIMIQIPNSPLPFRLEKQQKLLLLQVSKRYQTLEKRTLQLVVKVHLLSHLQNINSIVLVKKIEYWLTLVGFLILQCCQGMATYHQLLPLIRVMGI